MAISNRYSAPTFTVKKQYAWKEKLVRWVGSLLIVLVIAGTVFWTLKSADFSFANFASSFVGKLRPEIKTEKQKEPATPEEELRSLIEKDKLLEIGKINRTAEGDLLLTAKNSTVVLFSTKKELEGQVATLQTLLTKARIDNKALKKVDFRFEKIVVEY